MGGQTVTGWVVFKHKNTPEKTPNASFSHKSDFYFQMILRYTLILFGCIFYAVLLKKDNLKSNI